MAPVFSAELFKVWGESERSEFVNYCKSVLEKKKDSSLVFGNESTDINYVLYDLCKYCIQGEVTAEVAVFALSEIVRFHPELPSLVADILVVLDTESQVTELQGTRERFFNLLRYCHNKIVPEFTLKERLDFETLGDAGIMKLLRNVNTKFIKTKTRLFYKQQKYNLYREEIEGYAKLITELDPRISEEPNVEYALEVIKSLIGCFNLDPNRVLDVILEAFECKPNFSNFFTQLLHSYFGSSDTISQIIGFKFSFYQTGEWKRGTSASLYKVTAFLLKSKVMQLSQLYSLLTPDDAKIIEDDKQEMSNAMAYVKQLNSMSTNPEAIKESGKTETKVEVDDNQKLGLCAALLDVGDWEHARQLMSCFPEFYAASKLFIARKLCTLIHVFIDDFYNQCNFGIRIRHGKAAKLDSGVEVTKITSFTELFNDVFEMVAALGPHLHIDPVLMAKIIRLARHWIILKPADGPDYGIAAISFWLTIGGV